MVLLTEIALHKAKQSWEKSGQKVDQKILSLMTSNPSITTQEIAETLGLSRRAITKQIINLRKNNLIRRVEPAKGGHWEVIALERGDFVG